MRRITSITVAAAAIAASLSLAVPGGAALAAHSAPPARSTARSAALPVIKVAMNGKKITVSGALRSGGVNVVSTVTGEPAGNPTFVRLNPGVTVAQLLKAAQGDPNNVALIASIVFSPQANKGTSSAQANLAPGNYVAVDGGSNSKTPPLTTFKIAKASSPAKLPKPQARMSSIEFGFRGPGTLRNGELVRFANDGFVVHMIVAARGANLAGANKIAKLLKAGKDGRAQRLATGFTAFFDILTHGAYQQQVVHVRPGYWVLACFMDTQDGREHTQLGMERVIHITK
jgi:hypothetical protein